MKNYKQFKFFLVILFAGFIQAQTYPQPIKPPAVTQPSAQTAVTPAVTKPVTQQPAAAVPAKITSPIVPKPVDLNPNNVQKMREASKSKYNIWFSDQTKTNFKTYPYKKSFMSWPRIYEVNRLAVPFCKQQFKTLCGNEDFPLVNKFVTCLQENYEKFKDNGNCLLVAHYLVHAGFNRHLASTTEPCKTRFDNCLKSGDKTKSPGECMLAQQDLPPLCVKTMTDALKMRAFAAAIYDQKFLCASPESCK